MGKDVWWRECKEVGKEGDLMEDEQGPAAPHNHNNNKQRRAATAPRDTRMGNGRGWEGKGTRVPYWN